MGYSNYWRRPTELDAETFAKAIVDCRKICDTTAIPLGDWEGKGEPIFNTDLVAFNGKGVHRCESFIVRRLIVPERWQTPDKRGRYCEGCKTNLHLYDLYLKCCLIIFKYHFGDDFQINCDGEKVDWIFARIHCQTILGYGVSIEVEEW